MASKGMSNTIPTSPSYTSSYQGFQNNSKYISKATTPTVNSQSSSSASYRVPNYSSVSSTQSPVQTPNLYQKTNYSKPINSVTSPTSINQMRSSGPSNNYPTTGWRKPWSYSCIFSIIYGRYQDIFMISQASIHNEDKNDQKHKTNMKSSKVSLSDEVNLLKIRARSLFLKNVPVYKFISLTKSSSMMYPFLSKSMLLRQNLFWLNFLLSNFLWIKFIQCL